MMCMDDLKKNRNVINKLIIKSLEKKVWPMRDSLVCQLINGFVLDVQVMISTLSKQEDERVFIIINDYCFSLIFRVYSVDNLYRRTSRKISGTDGIVLLTDMDCMRLLELTDYKKVVNNIKKGTPKSIKRVWIPKPNSKEKRPLGIGTILDRALQFLLFLVMDPFYEAVYPKDMYGFRKGRSPINAVARVQKLMAQGQNKSFVNVDIEKYFDTISTQSMLKKIKIPKKFKNLVVSWLTSNIIDEVSNKIIPMSSGVPQGSIIGPLFANIMLKDLENHIFGDQPRSFKRINNNKGYQVSNNVIIFGDNIIVLSNTLSSKVIMERIQSYFEDMNVKLSKKKTKIWDMTNKKRFDFDFLGYSFKCIPNMDIKKGSLISKDSEIYRRKNKNPSIEILVTIKESNLKNHKEKLKNLIRKSYNLSVPEIIIKLNPIINGFANYYSFAQTYRYLSWLDMYVKKRILILLKKKYKKSSVNWIVSNFFDEKWNLVGSFSQAKTNDKMRERNIKILIKHTSVKVVPLHRGLLSKKIRNKSYYLNMHEYAKDNSKRWEHLIYKNKIYKLLLRSEGICKICSKPLNVDEENIDIHHIYPLKHCFNTKQIKESNKLDNTIILHSWCHRVLHSKKGDKKDKEKYIKKFI